MEVVNNVECKHLRSEQYVANRRVKRMPELNDVNVPNAANNIERDTLLESRRSMKNIINEHLTTLAHGCIVTFTLFIIYKCATSTWGLFTLHPLFYAIGWVLLMTESVMLFSKDNILSSRMDRATRIRLHWILQTVGLALSTVAFLAAYVNKINKNKVHFHSWHGLFGLISMILCYLTCTNGTATLYCMELKSIISPKLNKIFHTSTGIATVLIGMVTVILGLYSNWFNHYVGRNVDIFLVCFIAASCGLFWSAVRPSITLCRRIRGT